MQWELEVGRVWYWATDRPNLAERAAAQRLLEAGAWVNTSMGWRLDST